MPCLIVVHLRGRGRSGDGDWEANDVVQVFDARKTNNVIEAFIGNVWKTDLGRAGSREFLALYIQDCTLAEARAFGGRAKGVISWESHFTARERDNILNRADTVTFQEKARITKTILRLRARRG